MAAINGVPTSRRVRDVVADLHISLSATGVEFSVSICFATSVCWWRWVSSGGGGVFFGLPMAVAVMFLC